MGKQTIVYLDSNKLNLSPLNSVEKVDFVSNDYELLKSINKNHIPLNNNKDIFWLDKSMSKWKILLNEYLR